MHIITNDESGRLAVVPDFDVHTVRIQALDSYREPVEIRLDREELPMMIQALQAEQLRVECRTWNALTHDAIDDAIDDAIPF